MSRIRVLREAVAKRIAAGEVVERSASVVKETACVDFRRARGPLNFASGAKAPTVPRRDVGAKAPTPYRRATGSSGTRQTTDGESYTSLMRSDNSDSYCDRGKAFDSRQHGPKR
jgi:hypothetical protein